MKRVVPIIVLALTAAAQPAPVHAQGIRGLIGDLFIFGQGQDPLFLAGTADPNNPQNVQVHGEHFIPAAVEGNATVISFLTNAISSNVANIPFSATSSGRTFRFEGGVPVATSTSPGPIIGERAQTLGRGRLLIGASVTFLDFKTLRGVDLDGIRLNFTHENSDFPGCDAIFGDDCTVYGVPSFENDFIALDLDLELRVRATTFALTYGLLDRVDIGVAVPLITTDLDGISNAQVFPFGGTTAAHFFDGTTDSPDLFAERTVSGSASGLGDIATRLKVNLSTSGPAQFAILADARFATGSEEDLLGSGYFSLRSLGILSAQFGGFGPHANAGYLYRDTDLQNDAFLATLGFDQILAPWATLALDLVTELQVGDSELEIPGTVVLESPFLRRINPTAIPDIRDDVVNASAGLRFQATSGLTFLINSMWPLNNGGLRPDVLWTTGLEYNF